MRGWMLAAVLIGSCAQTHDTGDADADASEHVDAVIAASTTRDQALCARATRCDLEVGRSAETVCAPPSEIAAAIRANPDAARALVDEAMLARCVEDADGACAVPLDPSGTVLNPAACRAAVTWPDLCGGCADEAFCGFNGCGPDRCRPLPALGEWCGWRCAAGYACTLGWCSDCHGDSECADGTCVAGVCSGIGDLGDPCGGRSRCAPGLRCTTIGCVAAAAAGERCDTMHCVLGTACIEGTCVVLAPGDPIAGLEREHAGRSGDERTTRGSALSA